MIRSTAARAEQFARNADVFSAKILPYRRHDSTPIQTAQKTKRRQDPSDDQLAENADAFSAKIMPYRRHDSAPTRGKQKTKWSKDSSDEQLAGNSDDLFSAYILPRRRHDSAPTQAAQNMISRPAPPAKEQLAVNSSIGPKMFVKKFDEDGKPYHVLNTELNQDLNPGWYGKGIKSFEVSNLVLDLDAEGSKHVRPFDDNDEALMKAKWTETPIRIAARARSKRMEEQITESRRKARAILYQPTNVWRITPHDIMSAALHGGSAIQRTKAIDYFLHDDDDDEQSIMPDKTEGSWTAPYDLFEKIRVQNGIPSHAAQDDHLFLKWMALRYKSVQSRSSSYKVKGQAGLPPFYPTQALAYQSSITEIRRLVFQCLKTGSISITSFQKIKHNRQREDLPGHIRDACERLLVASPTDLTLRTETLTFLGNLSELLSRQGMHLDSLLSGLALALAAKIGSLEATSAWLSQCHLTKETLSHSKAISLSQDVLSTLHSLQVMVATHIHDPAATAAQQQSLLQVLTGIDEDNELTPESMRSFVANQFIKGNHGGEDMHQQLIMAYVSTLGRLGAVRTIWMEWRELVPARESDAKLDLQRSGDLALAFAAAMKQAIGIGAISASDGRLSVDASLEECVTADYHAMETLNCALRTNAAALMRNLPDATSCRSVMNLSLDACMAEIRSWKL